MSILSNLFKSPVIGGMAQQYNANADFRRQQDAEEAQAALDAVARKEAEDAKKARIESAKTKLQDLGLTLDEVKDAFNI